MADRPEADKKLPQRILWALEILSNAHPAQVEPVSHGMKKAAHWAWSKGLAFRHFHKPRRVTYSISPSGRAALREGGDNG